MLSVVVRFHDSSARELLAEAIFSLVCQKVRPLEAVVVCQNFSSEEMAGLRAYLEPYGASIDLTIINPDVGSGDKRARLLNEGVKAAANQYLAFLDYDDVIYPSGYASLIRALQRTPDAAMAIGNIMMADVSYVNNVSYTTGRSLRDPRKVVADLCIENFAPIHSYVIDRSRCSSPDELTFDETLSILEDYEFLLRMISRHRVIAPMHHTVGEYRLRNSHTMLEAGSKADALRQSLHAAILERLRGFKRSATFTLTQAETAELRNFWLGQAGQSSSTEKIHRLQAEVRASKEEVSSLQALVAAAAENAKNWPVWELGRIDSLPLLPDGRRGVQGWIIDDKKTPFSGSLFCFSGDEHLTALTVDRNRSDIQKHHGVRQAGFAGAVGGTAEPIVFFVREGKIHKLKRSNASKAASEKRGGE